jgi:SAM-dependent methyltransferase
MSNINDSFFDGHYKEIWKNVIPEELTIKEVAFMIPFFSLGEQSKVLDMMCGYGRHALALGRKGIAVTAIDNQATYIDEINEASKKENLPVTGINNSIQSFIPKEKFDLAICMGNSLQFFGRKELVEILSTVSDCMKPGGQLLINSWSIAEIAFRNFKDKANNKIGDLEFEVESRFETLPSRIEVRSKIISADGNIEERNSIDYIYSINEMASIFEDAGFLLQEVYSIPGRKKFTLGEPRAYFVAKNPGL